MWSKCPTQQDEPVTTPYFGVQLQDVYIGLGIASVFFLAWSPLHGLGIFLGIVALLTVLKRGKAPGWMFHVLWSLDLWYIPGALRVETRHYTVWHE